MTTNSALHPSAMPPRLYQSSMSYPPHNPGHPQAQSVQQAHNMHHMQQLQHMAAQQQAHAQMLQAQAQAQRQQQHQAQAQAQQQQAQVQAQQQRAAAAAVAAAAAGGSFPLAAAAPPKDPQTFVRAVVAIDAFLKQLPLVKDGELKPEQVRGDIMRLLSMLFKVWDLSTDQNKILLFRLVQTFVGMMGKYLCPEWIAPLVNAIQHEATKAALAEDEFKQLNDFCRRIALEFQKRKEMGDSYRTYFHPAPVVQGDTSQWVLRLLKNRVWPAVDARHSVINTCRKDGIAKERLSLVDSYSQARIKIPARGSKCTHLSVFDLKTYLDLNFAGSNNKRSRWQCPMCNKEALPNRIVIDGFISEILMNTDDDTRAVYLHDDGSWKGEDLSAEGKPMSARKRRRLQQQATRRDREAQVAAANRSAAQQNQQAASAPSSTGDERVATSTSSSMNVPGTSASMNTSSAAASSSSRTNSPSRSFVDLSVESPRAYSKPKTHLQSGIRSSDQAHSSRVDPYLNHIENPDQKSSPSPPCTSRNSVPVATLVNLEIHPSKPTSISNRAQSPIAAHVAQQRAQASLSRSSSRSASRTHSSYVPRQQVPLASVSRSVTPELQQRQQQQASRAPAPGSTRSLPTPRPRPIAVPRSGQISPVPSINADPVSNSSIERTQAQLFLDQLYVACMNLQHPFAHYANLAPPTSPHQVSVFSPWIRDVAGMIRLAIELRMLPTLSDDQIDNVVKMFVSYQTGTVAQFQQHQQQLTQQQLAQQQLAQQQLAQQQLAQQQLALAAQARAQQQQRHVQRQAATIAAAAANAAAAARGHGQRQPPTAAAAVPRPQSRPSASSQDRRYTQKQLTQIHTAQAYQHAREAQARAEAHNAAQAQLHAQAQAQATARVQVPSLNSGTAIPTSQVHPQAYAGPEALAQAQRRSLSRASEPSASPHRTQRASLSPTAGSAPPRTPPNASHYAQSRGADVRVSQPFVSDIAAFQSRREATIRQDHQHIPSQRKRPRESRSPSPLPPNAIAITGRVVDSRSRSHSRAPSMSSSDYGADFASRRKRVRRFKGMVVDDRPSSEAMSPAAEPPSMVATSTPKPPASRSPLQEVHTSITMPQEQQPTRTRGIQSPKQASLPSPNSVPSASTSSTTTSTLPSPTTSTLLSPTIAALPSPSSRSRGAPTKVVAGATRPKMRPKVLKRLKRRHRASTPSSTKDEQKPPISPAFHLHSTSEGSKPKEKISPDSDSLLAADDSLPDSANLFSSKPVPSNGSSVSTASSSFARLSLKDGNKASSSCSSLSSNSTRDNGPPARPVKRRKIPAVSSQRHTFASASNISSPKRKVVESQSSLDLWATRSPKPTPKEKGDSLESLPVGRSPHVSRSSRKEVENPSHVSQSSRTENEVTASVRKSPHASHSPREEIPARSSSRLRQDQDAHVGKPSRLHHAQDLSVSNSLENKPGQNASKRAGAGGSNLAPPFSDEPEVTRRSPRFVHKPPSIPAPFVSYIAKKGKSKSPTPNSSSSSSSNNKTSSRSNSRSGRRPTATHRPPAVRTATTSKSSTSDKRKGSSAEMDLTVSLPTPSADKKSSDSEKPAPGVYEVEKVMNRRKCGNSVQYLLKWKGYPHSDNTWEYEDDMECTQLIDDYLNSIGELDEVSYVQEGAVIDVDADDSENSK